MNDNQPVGTYVKYVDFEGKEHDALITHVWSTCVNLVYVGSKSGDSFGNERLYATSVPPHSEGMNGNYFYPHD